MDLDNFKSVNEALGHQAGDDAIRLYSRTVKDVLCKFGEVYRRGGDEVVAFAPGLDHATSKRLAEDVRVAIESRFAEWGASRGLTTFPTSSIGLVLSGNGSTVEDTIHLMDEAQRQAKSQGKNRVVVSVCPPPTH